MNVMINLKDLDEKLYVNKKQNEIDKLLSKGKTLHEKLFNNTIKALTIKNNDT